jgi:hypothetical protein
MVIHGSYLVFQDIYRNPSVAANILMTIRVSDMFPPQSYYKCRMHPGGEEGPTWELTIRSVT